MKEKLIIENRTDLDMIHALQYACTVIYNGKVSETSKGKQYCFHTTFEGGIRVAAYKNEQSDRLVIYTEGET